MSPHPGNMSVWSDIRCQRDCPTHYHRTVDVFLGGPTPYHDYAPIPDSLSRTFVMEIWDPDKHPVDNGAYCPARDAVSATIFTAGVWEVRETILALSVFQSTTSSAMTFLDFGAQLGWFSLLAASCGLKSYAYEADVDNISMIQRSAALNGWSKLIHPIHHRITSDSPPLYPTDERIRFAKIDVEGAEDAVVEYLWPLMIRGDIDHLLIEISPTFADYYPKLVADIISIGYEAYLLPNKQRPPLPLEDLPHDLAPYRFDHLDSAEIRRTVADWKQENVWFAHKGARW